MCFREQSDRTELTQSRPDDTRAESTETVMDDECFTILEVAAD